MAQLTLGYFLKYGDEKKYKRTLDFFLNFLNTVSTIELKENQYEKTIYILDQFDKINFEDKKKLHVQLLSVFRKHSKKEILICTMTDEKIKHKKAKESANVNVIILDENRKPLSESEMNEICKKMFCDLESNFLYKETNGSLYLILQFYNYCAGNNYLQKNLKTPYEKFAKQYYEEQFFKHDNWTSYLNKKLTHEKKETKIQLHNDIMVNVFGGLWEHYWFQKLLIGKQMNISIYLVPQKKVLLLNMTEIEILNVKHSEGFAKITFDLVRNTEKPIPVMFRALQENFPLFESCFLAENKDFAFINHKLSSGFSDGNFVNMVTDKYSKYLNQAKQQLGYI